jgi:nitrous-oxide reductase
VLYDMPMGIGEPHYAQIIKADKIQGMGSLPGSRLGSDYPVEVSEFATKAGEERIERDGNNVTIYMTSIRSHLTPEHESPAGRQRHLAHHQHRDGAGRHTRL